MKILAYRSFIAGSAFLLSCLPLLAAANPAITLPSLFGDNMVLQRDKPVPVWGWADPGATVKVSFERQAKSAVADASGRWQILLDPLPASAEPRTLSVSSPAGTKDIANVLVGEVWLCSGQSNMEYGIANCLNAQEEIAAANDPGLRLFLVPKLGSDLPQKDVNANWKVGSPQAVAEGGWGGFSAVAYYFGRELRKNLKVPVGLVDSCYGGTMIESWVPGEAWRSVKELEKTKPSSNLFNAMIAPLAPYALRGAIWYQGESNMNDGMLYFHKMRALIGGWREVWRKPPGLAVSVPGDDFPFYFAQLTSFANGGEFVMTAPAGNFGWPWPTLREAQVKAMEIPHTGMAVTMDIGRADKDQHAMNKQDVGKRLAQWALAKDYGKKVAFSRPIYRGCQVKGREVRITFDHAEGGLIVGEKIGLEPVKELPGGKLKWLAIAGADQKFYWADARIDGQTLVVSSKEVPAPVAVRYAFTMFTDGAMLYNKAGLPASQFRTDHWLRFEPTVESLKQYTVPEWFQDAKLGMWGHWGPQGSTDIPYPIDSGWYARFMYEVGNPVYEWHVKNFGHPSVFGYKDILKRWNPSKFDAAQADRLVKLYKQAGAKFFVALGTHHDNYDLWDSKYQPRWNAKATTGKDIVGLWHDAAKNNGLRFGVSSHVARTYRWFQTSHGGDAAGKFDGQDPAYQDLYGVPWPASSSPDYEQMADVGPAAWELEFENRMKDLMDKYHPDLYYTDGGIPFKQAGLNILSHLYNQNQVWNGSLEAVAAIKLDYQENIAVQDYEFGSSSSMAKYPFMSDKTSNLHWWWSKGEAPHYRKANEVVDYLIDLVSKNGVLCLNIPLTPDGSIEPESVSMLKEMGQCLNVIGEAIFKTRVWTSYGEGPSNMTDFASGTAKDIRFTRNKENNVLYATVLDWPGNGATLTVGKLASDRFDAKAISAITLLGSPAKLVWNQDESGLHVVMPAAAPNSLFAYSLKIVLKGLLPRAAIRHTNGMINDDDDSVSYSGGWYASAGRAESFGNDIHETPNNGDSFSIAFTGTGVEFVTITAANRGEVDIYLDGTLQQTINCQSPTDQSKQTVYSKTGLTPGAHTLKGVKKSGAYLSVDAFKVSGTP
jgi:alpha-L-fucosidase